MKAITSRLIQYAINGKTQQFPPLIHLDQLNRDIKCSLAPSLKESVNISYNASANFDSFS